MRRLTVPCIVVCLLALTSSLSADVRTDQRVKFQLGGVIGKMVNMFGGKGAREGVTSMVAVKGNRKATMSDTTGQIVDLTEEKVYDLDIKKKTYKVTTFAELRRQLEEARKKAAEDMKKAQAEQKAEKPAAAEPASNDASRNKRMTFILGPI